MAKNKHVFLIDKIYGVNFNHFDKNNKKDYNVYNVEF